ncbi:L-glutaminase [Salegentibacter sp. 24]|uniref:glutaminase family protein n=1 Tax=Salegentibacter sp. 24 TaxID=2183986 RepID=UPI00105B4754|nr:glutaminase family protein [Salegentibacter sp. 24]TDN95062.1 L-glutaminase [Salegentibacter sp. 24]
MKNYILFSFLIFSFFLNAQQRQAPAYPLVTHDPYLSIWSFTDEINAQPTKHWTGTDHSLIGYINVDGKNYRFLGKETKSFKWILSSSKDDNFSAMITQQNPGPGWEEVSFDDSSWERAQAPYGDENANAATAWESEDLWVRREFDLENTDLEKLFLKLHHDDNIEVFLNGDPIFKRDGWTSNFEYHEISESVINKIKAENNIIAIHIKNTAGGQWLDFGLAEEIVDQHKTLVAEQNSVEFNATQTIYSLTCGGVDVELTFTSPLLMDNLDIFSRPVSYISTKVRPNDDKPHAVQVYFGASSSIAVNENSQEVMTEKSITPSLTYLKAGTKSQPILEKRGDDLRIDWGYMYVAAPKDSNARQMVIPAAQAKNNFFEGETGESEPSGEKLMLATVFPKETIHSEKEHLILLGYDDIYSINYFGEQLRPYWNKDGNSSLEIELEKAYSNYEDIIEECRDFDEELYEDGLESGGENYAHLLEIAYRQSIAAHKLLESPKGDLLFLSKENNSNGSVNTVDVTYPSAPLFLIYNPDLLKGMLNGIFYYSESGKWKKPFPAHDLGTYPIATGQTYGEDMPVEEAGNMIILTAAIAKSEGNAEYAREHWETLTTWANYLAEKGLDPENQLSTDDFSGHLARNANLSIKAIMAIASYGYLADELEKEDVAGKYTKMAKTMAREWMELADAGDHYALTFNDKNTWSQKYNLVWDKVMDLDVFPDEVIEKELAYYKTKQNQYGLPLDNRSEYSKSDWILWTATLTDNMEDFQFFANPVYKFATETPDRVPMSDWHWTHTGEVRGFKARSVVGGYFIKLLEDHWE